MSKTKVVLTPEDVIAAVLADADQRETNAAYSGSYGDDGASTLREQVAVWRAGREKTIPACWVPYVKKAEAAAKERLKKADPDYPLYQKLKARFEIEKE